MQSLVLNKYTKRQKTTRLINPKVSVITVCYNSAATIERTIFSVKNQSYKNIEYIIVDGKSHDSTIQIVKKFRFIDKLISEEDAGIYDAMNKGISAASGQIIAFLNADDFYKKPNIVEKAVKKIVSAELDAVYGDVDFFSSNDTNKILRRYSSKFFSPKKLAYGLMPAHPSIFMKKEIFKVVGKFDINYKIAGDFDFILRAFKDNHLRYLYIPEVFVTMQNGGVSTRGLKSTIILNKEIMQSCIKNGIKTNWARLISRYFVKIFEFIGLSH